MRFLLLIGFLFFSAVAPAQPADSAAVRDSLRLNSLRLADSLRRDSLRIDSLRADTLMRLPPPVYDTLRPTLRFALGSDSFRLQKHLFYTFTNPVRYTISEKKWEGKEPVFYAVVALLLLFGFVRTVFSRYLSDLNSSYFRTTVRQKQIREQLLQSPLPSLFFNLFFVLSAAVFLSLLVQRFGYADRLSFPVLLLYSAAGIAVVYAGKFLLLKIFGWVFQLTEAADAYLFIVFSTNKLLGIFLLPFSVLLAFTSGPLNAAAVTLGAVVVLAFFAYRFFLAFLEVGHLVRLNLFHFLLYLAAFEVIPLLLINKALFRFLREMV